MGQKILVVEDDEVQLRVIQHAVQKCCPSHLVTASSVAQAIALLEAAGPDYFAVVFLDLLLPGGHGTEVVRHVRSASSIVPIVVVSESDREADIYASYRHGANAYMVKPEGAADLERAVEIAAEFWLNLNTLPMNRLVAVEPHSQS
jgi:CheY-like chemotaxis protein